MTAEVFVSYSSKDTKRVLEYVELLEASQVSLWISKKKLYGAEQWRSKVVESIENCKAVILFLSRDSITSEDVIKEITLASKNNKPILPLHLEKVKIPKTMGYQLVGVHHYQLFEGDINQHTARILDSLNKLGINSTRPSSKRLKHILQRPFSFRKGGSEKPIESALENRSDKVTLTSILHDILRELKPERVMLISIGVLMFLVGQAIIVLSLFAEPEKYLSALFGLTLIAFSIWPINRFFQIRKEIMAISMTTSLLREAKTDSSKRSAIGLGKKLVLNFLG